MSIQDKQVSCNICFKPMIIYNLKRHMKVHLKSNENQNTTKRKCNEIDINNYVDTLEKMLEEQTAKYNRKIALGKRVAKILKKGEVKQAALVKDMQ